MFLCSRAKLLPPLKIRLARVEDHDDLVPIFNKKSELNPGIPYRYSLICCNLTFSFTELHSTYFLANLMAKAGKENGKGKEDVVLVAEGLSGRAVGIMSVTTQLDVRVLRKAFYLDPFNFLNGTVNFSNWLSILSVCYRN